MTQAPDIRYPRHPAHLDPFVVALGPRDAVRFLIAFAGCELYFAATPRGASAAAQFIGTERLRDLTARLGGEGAYEVPIPTVWLVHALKAEGKSVNDICSTLKRSRTMVQNCLKKSAHGGSHPAEQPDPHPGLPADDDQLTLF